MDIWKLLQLMWKEEIAGQTKMKLWSIRRVEKSLLHIPIIYAGEEQKSLSNDSHPQSSVVKIFESGGIR